MKTYAGANVTISKLNLICVALSRLFEEGNFEPILVKIFRLLDGHSLESCSLVRSRIVITISSVKSFWTIRQIC